MQNREIQKLHITSYCWANKIKQRNGHIPTQAHSLWMSSHRPWLKEDLNTRKSCEESVRNDQEEFPLLGERVTQGRVDYSSSQLSVQGPSQQESEGSRSSKQLVLSQSQLRAERWMHACSRAPLAPAPFAPLLHTPPQLSSTSLSYTLQDPMLR